MVIKTSSNCRASNYREKMAVLLALNSERVYAKIALYARLRPCRESPVAFCPWI
jgi:hypothetical protein